MSRFSYYDTDEERLPEGFERVGYDADTGVYTYRDTRDGSYWEGPAGSRYGRLTRVGAPAPGPRPTPAPPSRRCPGARRTSPCSTSS